MSTAADNLRSAMDELGVTDDTERAGIAAIAYGESGLEPVTESSYRGTNNQKLRRLFGDRLAGLTDPALTELKRDDPAFFDRVYGGDWGRRNLGNTEPGDGYRYRGRGPFQLTGRGNYAQIGKDVGADLANHPELVNDPVIGPKTAVAYFKRRYHGGGWEKMKDAVGFNVPSVAATKDAAFRRYRASGEFSYRGETPSRDPVVVAFLDALHDLQRFLRDNGSYRGAIDDDPGPGTRAALAEYLRSHGS